jgi:uroporphyrinogen-III decarboxylase
MWDLENCPDFEEHNAEVERVWKAYHDGKPYRVPVTVYGSIRNLLLNPAMNDAGYTFRGYYEDPEVQINAQLAYEKWVRWNFICDNPMGPPAEGWQVNVDFQNSYDQGWFGCPVSYLENAVPDTAPILKDSKERLYDLEPPDALRGGLLGRAMEFFEYMNEKCPRMEFEGLPVKPPMTIPGDGTDGPFTIACKIRGTMECCIDMLEDEKYFHDLMEFVTENIIRRIKAIREWRWERESVGADERKFKRAKWGLADDSTAMLSVEQYEEFIFPYHKRFAAEFSDGGPMGMHLCGDATHLFKFLVDNFNVRSFDTGFPVDFGGLRKELGPEVEIYGGPTIMLLRSGPAGAVRAEAKRILSSGISDGGRFVLRDANNLAPCTPIEHLAAMYETAKEFGTY